MDKRMARVNAQDLRAGMVLATDAKNTQGRLLLPRGLVLEDQHIRVLALWGVIDVDIENVTREEARRAMLEAMDPTCVETARNHVNILFSQADTGSAPMGELRDLCVKLYAQRFHEGERVLVPGGIQTVSHGPAVSATARKDSPIVRRAFLPASADEFVRMDQSLASFPCVYFQLLDALENPQSTAAQLAEIIAHDPNMSARLLRLVNSPLYGFGQRVDSLSRGVVLVGARDLTQLALGVAVLGEFVSVPDGVITVREVWRRSVARAVISRAIASHMPDMEQERCFLVGLLRDIGRLVMLKLAPDDLAEAIVRSQDRGASMSRVEKEMFGFDHVDVASSLFQLWRLPDSLLPEAVLREHPQVGGDTKREAAVCALAGTMAAAMGYGFTGTAYVRTLREGLWQTLELPESVMEVAFSTSARQISDVFAAFLG